MNQRIVAAVDDIFFAAKIRGAAEQLGVAVEFVRGVKALLETVEREAPSLIIADLHSQLTDPFAAAESLKADERLRTIPLVGFFSHVQTELKKRAIDAGFDRVLPRSAFTVQLPEILQGKL